jgi:hypothetical protein
VYHSTLVHWYHNRKIEVERIQTGVRMERRILKVLKALVEYKNITLGDLLEGIVLHDSSGLCAAACVICRSRGHSHFP